jgi:hypothetical protein
MAENTDIQPSSNEPVLLHHKKCRNTWLYTGNNPFVACCSFCKSSIRIKKNRVTKFVIQVPQDKIVGDDHQAVVQVSRREQLADDGINHLEPTGKRGVLNDNRHRS